jgi:Phage major tail protein 2.
MATIKGNGGTVKVGANEIAEIRSFSVDETSDTIEDTAMGDTYRTFKTSLKSWSGSVDVFFDDTDLNGQVTLVPGAEATVTFFVEGDTSGSHTLSGSAIVTSRTINSSFDGMVEASLSLQGNGALTESTV